MRKSPDLIILIVFAQVYNSVYTPRNAMPTCAAAAHLIYFKTIATYVLFESTWIINMHIFGIDTTYNVENDNNEISCGNLQ